MLAETYLNKLALKKQTTYQNYLREYVQLLFLRSFYQQKGADYFLFKGGTALRLVFGSPRFSEDLDFSGLKNTHQYEAILTEVMLDLNQQGLIVDLIESKPTSGGHLAKIEVKVYKERIQIKQEISFRPHKENLIQIALASSELLPPYQIYILKEEQIVAEKIKALLTRQKIRDYFDLYFILRDPKLRAQVKLTTGDRDSILKLVNKLDKSLVFRELKPLLPESYSLLIRDLPEVLKRELER